MLLFCFAGRLFCSVPVLMPLILIADMNICGLLKKYFYLDGRGGGTIPVTI
jgi:hypothetical protein